MGFTITPDVRCETEIEKRMALSKDTFTKMKYIFTNRNIKIYTKINTLKVWIEKKSNEEVMEMAG